MKNVIIALTLTTLLVGCSDSDTAIKALSGAGYTDIKTTGSTGYAWFACGRDDSFATGFTAKGPTGVPVTGAVCSSLLIKNATIRTN